MKFRWLTTIAAGLAISAFGGFTALAQEKGAPGDDAAQLKHDAMHRGLEKILKHIAATPAQANQIFEIRSQYEHRKLGLKMSGASKEQMMAQFKTLQDQAAQAMGKVLSPAQVEKLQPIGGIPALLGEAEGQNPWDFLTKLDLTQAQAIQVKQIIAHVHQALSELKQDGSLSGEQIKSRAEQIHESAMGQIHGILTPDQIRQLHEIMGGNDPHDKPIDPSGPRG